MICWPTILAGGGVNILSIVFLALGNSGLASFRVVAVAKGKAPLTMQQVLTAMISPSGRITKTFNQRQPRLLVKVVVAEISGLTRDEISTLFSWRGWMAAARSPCAEHWHALQGGRCLKLMAKTGCYFLIVPVASTTSPQRFRLPALTVFYVMENVLLKISSGGNHPNGS